MKEVLLIAAYIVGASELALGVYFWVTNSKNEIRRVMSALAFSTGVWAIASAATSYIDYSLMGLLLVNLAYLSGLVLVTKIVELSVVFPFKIFAYDKLHQFLLYVPVVVFGVMIFFSRTIVASFSGSSTSSGTIDGGPLFFLYNGYLVICFFAALTLLAYKVTITSGYLKYLLRLVIASFILGGMPGIIQYLILPNFNPGFMSNMLHGVIATIIWVGVTSYIVIRR